MGNVPSLGKYGKFGIQIQSAEGVEADGASVVWMPLCDAPSFKWHPNPTLIDAADHVEYDHQQYSEGQFWMGGVSVYFYPGARDTLLDWIQTKVERNQGKWATLWLVDQNESLVRTAKDCKVRTAEFPLEKGRPVRVNLDVVGKSDGSHLTPTDYDSELIAAPFIRKDITITLKAAGTSDTDMGYTFEGGTIRLDCQLQDPMDGLRYNGSYNPYTLYNNGAIKCTGEFTRDFIDSKFYTAWRKQYEVGSAGGYDWYDDDYDSYIKVAYARGSAVFNIEMPRVRIDDVDTGMVGSRVGRQNERVTWKAMGSADGTIAPVLLS